MNKGLVYYYKRVIVNSIKNLKRKPLKSLGKLILGLYFMLLPFLLKDTIANFGLNNAKGYIAVYAVFSIFLGMPSLLTYFKRKGLIFKEADINFMFISPVSPKAIILHGMIKNILVYIIQYIVYFIAAVFVFNIPVIKALIISLTCMVFTNTIEISLAIIMYGSERITDRGKRIIKYIVFGILLSLLALLSYKLFSKGLSVANVLDFLTGDYILLVPVFGWEIGFLRLVLMGSSNYVILATMLYFISSVVLFIAAYKMKTTGEFYEEALSFSEEYTKALEKSKSDGSVQWAGKKTKTRKIDFSTKGKFAKSIFYKQLDEFKKVSFLSKYGKILLLFTISIILGVIFRIEEEVNINDLDSSIVLIVYAVSSYFAMFFTKTGSWRKEFDNYYTYLIPDSSRNKVLYATLLQNIKNLVEGFAITLPISLIIGLPIYTIPLNALLYSLVHVTILYVDFILREILSKKIGEGISQFIMLGVDALVLLLGGGIIFVSMVFFKDSIVLSYILVYIFLVLVSAVGLFFSSKLYGNMEFVND